MENIQKMLLKLCVYLSPLPLFSQQVPHNIIRPIDYGVHQNTSLIKLIARPEDFDNQEVQVIGFLHIGFEGSNMYIDQESYRSSISENGIIIKLPDSLRTKDFIHTYNNKYVILMGRFNKNSKGVWGTGDGVIENIIRIDLWKNVDDIHKMQEYQMKEIEKIKTMKKSSGN